MKGYYRFLIGAAGGFTPILALLMVVDYQKHFVDATTPQTVGFIVRSIILFIAGGFWAWLHKTEDAELKIFQIGMAAPAVVAGALTASSLAPHRTAQAPLPTAFAAFISVTHGTAVAQPLPAASTPSSLGRVKRDEPLQTAPSQAQQPLIPVKKFVLPPLPAYSEFFEGLIGVPVGTPKDVWFTIVASTPTRELAIAKALEIKKATPSFNVEVYEPYGRNPYWAVTIGSNLDRSSALRLKNQAKNAGLPQDTYVWTDARYR